GGLVIFYAAGALSLIGALVAVSRRGARAAIAGHVAAVAGVATIAVQVLAPLVAIVLAVATAWSLALLARAAEADAGAADPAEIEASRLRRWAPRIAAALGLGLLAWVFLGTWGRQQAFAGHDLAGGASFGGVRELASAASADLAGLWIVAPLLLLAAALGAVALLDLGSDDQEAR
ncbi:MAG: hypothetical protein R3B09_35405, partial [Nannocystaceae bacterium]